MPFEINCQSCGQRLHIPVRGKAHRVVCPRCHGVVHTLAELDREEEEQSSSAQPPATEYFRRLSRTAEGLGTASLLAAFLAFAFLCVPFLGYLSILFSVMGIGLGIAGLRRNYYGFENEIVPTEEVAGKKWYEKRRLQFPVGGTVLSLLIFLLAIWPLLKGWR